MHAEIQTAEPLVHESTSCEVKTATGRLEKFINYQVLNYIQQIISAGSKILHSEIHKFINSIWNTE